MYQLTTIGDIKLDVFIDLGDDAKVACGLNREDCLIQIKYGEKIPVDSAVTMMAGSAPNVAIGARRLGVTTSIVSVVGDDTTATLAIDGLRQHGIPTDGITVEPNTQSSFSAVLNFEGESTMLAVHRPHAFSLPHTLNTQWLFVSEMGPTYKDLFRDIVSRVRGDGLRIGINPGAIQLEERDQTLFDLIRHAHLLIVNKEEAQDLCACGLEEMEPLLRTMQELGPRTVIITDGREGAWGTQDGDVYHAPMFPGERVEATGAGDAFSAGVLSALIMDEELSTALAWGSVNAASVVQYIGPQAGLLSREQIAAALRAQPSYKILTH